MDFSNYLKQVKTRKLHIESERLYAKILKPEDVSARYLKWFENERVKNFIMTPAPPTIKELQDYVSSKLDKEDCIFFGIYENESNLHVGNIKFEPIEWSLKKTNFGILFDPDAIGQGYALEACRLTYAFLFEKLGMDLVELSADKENDAAIRLYKKIGFKIVSEKPFTHLNIERTAVNMILKKKDFFSLFDH